MRRYKLGDSDHLEAVINAGVAVTVQVSKQDVMKHLWEAALRQGSVLEGDLRSGSSKLCRSLIILPLT
jgi:hypothetical protein